MEIYNLKDKLEYLNEVATLEYNEWANNKDENRDNRLENKKKKIAIYFHLNLFAN